MSVRKIFVSITKFLRPIKHNLDKIFIVIVSLCCFYFVLNDLFMERSLLPDANTLMHEKDYKAALGRYNLALFYYKLNHYTNHTKNNYFDVSYKVSVCQYNENQKKKAYENILTTAREIQAQYGFYSKENAYFIKKYLMEFYLENNELVLANNAFRSLLIVESKIGYSNSETADLTRLSGDIYFMAKDVNTALILYNRAYEIISKETKPDYEILMNITNRVAKNKLSLLMTKESIDLYKSSISIVRKAPKKQNEILVNLLVNLGDICAKNDYTVGEAAECYKEAIEITKKLSMKTTAKQNLVEYISTYKKLELRSKFVEKTSG